MKKERRWLKSALAAAAAPQAPLPWTRGSRRRPAAFKPTAPAVKPALAAR